MRILYDYQVLIQQKFGGVSRYLFELASYMRKNNDISIPVLFSQNYYFEKYFNKKSLKYKNRYLKFILRKINAVYTFFVISIAYIAKKPFDIIHASFYNPDYIYPYYKFIDKNHRTKFILTVYDMIQEMEADKLPNMKRSADAKRKAARIADGIITISDNTKADLKNIYSDIKDKEIETIYLAAEKVDSLCEVLNVDLPKRYVLYVGNRSERKNFRRTLKAFSIIHERLGNVELVCTGGGDLTAEELLIIDNLGLKGVVKQYFLEDHALNYAYAHAECFIFPSLYEGFGLPILEAWAARCPVLLSKSSCFPEIGGNAAVYFDGESVDEMAQELFRVLTSESLRRELIEKGNERIEMFSWEKTGIKSEEYYKRFFSNL